MKRDESQPDDVGQGSTVARLTPYELVFTEGEFEGRRFPRIDDESAEHQVDSRTPERFDLLTTVADILREVTPDEAPSDALEQYRALLFHAYHFWKGGRRLFVLERAVARFLVESASTANDWAFSAPARSGYLQLPQNLFWSSIAPDTPPEPVDGFFFTLSERSDMAGGPIEHLHLLLILGIRRGRAGFSVIGLDTDLEPGLLSSLEAERRPDGDFANTLPGGEISGLYSIVTVTEALKLVGRAFRYIERLPGAVERVDGVAAREETSEPPPTRLPFWRVRLSGE